MAIAGLYDIFNERWASQGTVWLYSDPHFNDPDLKAGIKRPSADEMVKMINSKVGRKDTFICLGDCGDLDYIRKIRGYKVLIAGNHDTGLSTYKEAFDEVYSGALFIGEKIVLSHEPIDIPFALNLHGHIHSPNHKDDVRHININCDGRQDYFPINFNQLMKSGPAAHIQSIHRDTIDKATKRKKKRGGKKIGEK